MRHIGEKIILVLCIVVFGIAAMNLVEIEKEYYDGQKEYEELKEYTGSNSGECKKSPFYSAQNNRDTKKTGSKDGRGLAHTGAVKYL